MGNKANSLRLIDYLTGQQSSALGRNYVLNPSAFINANNVTAANSATVTRNTTTPLTQISDFSITMPNNTTGTVTWSLNTLDNSLKNQNCELRLDYTASSIGSNVVVQVLQGSSIAVQSPALATASLSQTVSLNVPCGDLSSATTIVLANGSGNSGTSAVSIANLAYGKATNLSQVAQATLYGGINYPTTAGQDWSSTQTATYADIPANTSIPFPTGSNLIGNATAPSTHIPAITFSYLPPGEYLVVATGALYTSQGANGRAHYRIHDGTNPGMGESWTRTDSGGVSSSSQSFGSRFNYTTAQSNITFRMQSFDTSSGSSGVRNQDISFAMMVYKFPSSGELAVRPDVTPASWSGYQTVSSGWATSSTTYADPSAGSTIVLTQTTNRNFGTVSNAGSSLPGITFTPSRIGMYRIHASVTANCSGSMSWSARLVDGSSVLVDAGKTFGAQAGQFMNLELSGIYNVTSLAAVTFKVQMAVSGNTMTITNGNAAGSAAIQWDVEELDAAMPTPVLVGSVTSNATGVERLERVKVTATCSSSPCTIADQSGSWLTSITRTSTGIYVLNIASGIFSATPTCMTSYRGNENANGCRPVEGSATSVTVNCYNSSAALQDLTGGWNVQCMGPR